MHNILVEGELHLIIDCITCCEVVSKVKVGMVSILITPHLILQAVRGLNHLILQAVRGLNA